MSDNLLRNPELKGFTIFREFVDNNGNKGWMEHPDDWEYVWTPMHDDDPNRVPQSLHRDRGFVIAAGWRVWEAGYVQRGVALQGGQRYLTKAVFQSDVNFPSGREPDLSAVQWRFWVDGGAEQIWTEWQQTGNGRYKQEEEHLFVIEARSDITVDLYFKARSRWADNVCDFNIRSITLEPVAADFGEATFIGSEAAKPAGGQPRPAPAPVGQPAISPQPAPPGSDTPADLLAIMTDDDLSVIADGFRAAANTGMFNETIAAGFARWADVLERYRARKR